MEIIKAYKSTDGILFNTEEECEAHEASFFPGNLRQHIECHIVETYNDDAGFSIIELEDVVDYLVTFWNDIANIMSNR